MNANLAQLVRACELLGVASTAHHDSGNLIEVGHAGRSYFFAAWTTPLNDQALCHICLDKEFFYRLAHPLVRMPRTMGYFEPGATPKHRRYVAFPSAAAIAEHVLAQFGLPVIVKRNRGAGGDHVFRCDTPAEVLGALESIFDRGSPRFDYVALAQERIDIRREYRVIYLDGALQFAYEKNIDDARFTGNLSPLHWEGARAVLVEDAALLARLHAALAPLFARLPLRFCGLDVAIDKSGQIWLIEANTSPGFAYFIASCGAEQVTRLYAQILRSLFGPQLG